MILDRLIRKKSRDKPRPRLREGLRIYAIGDIHGMSHLLKALLTKIHSDIAAHPACESRLIFLGDYVDRGPDSKGVLDILTSGVLPAPAVCLLGNHEEILLSFLQRPEVAQQWRLLGGLETLASYGIDTAAVQMGRDLERCRDAFLQRLPTRHLQFLQGLHVFADIDDYFFCHAGVRPGVALDRQARADLLWVRDEFLAHRGSFGKVVVHGHTPGESVELAGNRINVDTGAYLTHCLSAVLLTGEEQRVIDSRASSYS